MSHFNPIMFSPMEQFIIFPVFSLNMSITNVTLYLFIAFLVTLFFSGLGFLTRPIKGVKGGASLIVGSNYQLFSESLFHTILNMLETFIGGKHAILYLPLFYSLFHLILFSNLLGLIPYSVTPTVELVLTLSFAITASVGFLLIGVITHKLYLLAIFLPAGTPNWLIPLMVGLEIIAYISRTVSLGLR
jgi:F0F1-type ATP synthase membrane subunit a